MRALNSCCVSGCILWNYAAANNTRYEVCMFSADHCLQQTDAFLHLLAALFFPTLSALVVAMLGNGFTLWKEGGYLLFCSGSK